MAQQQREGWPLGLQPVNVRIGLVRSRDFSGSTSFNTLLSGSPTSSTDSSSDLDTESTESFFHDRSTTLGSLIGVSNIVHLSGRSMRGRNTENKLGNRTSYKSKSSWCFVSLCPKDRTDAETSMNINNPSLGHFLELERRDARSIHRPVVIYGPDELALAQPDREQNSLFVNGRIAPPASSSPWPNSDVESRGVHDSNGYGVPLLFPCMCGH